TLRRHLQGQHKVPYMKFCKENEFESKLPRDVKQRKAESMSKEKQTSLDKSLVAAAPVIPYSDSLFKRAAAEFIVETNQSLRITEQASFVNMIKVASRARDGVKI
ncbi:hypothetical protein EV715DRAFT_174976, partial [Schizophyllum commune]